MTRHTPHDFNPSPAETDDLVSALAGDVTASLSDLASRFETTIEALTLWMTRPEIADRLANLESACMARTRLAAANYLPLAVASLRCVLADFNQVHGNLPYERSNLRAITLRHRAAEAARRAAAILLRLSTITPGPRPRRPAGPPSIAPAVDTLPASRPAALPAPFIPQPTTAPAAPSMSSFVDRSPAAMVHEPQAHEVLAQAIADFFQASPDQHQPPTRPVPRGEGPPADQGVQESPRQFQPHRTECSRCSGACTTCTLHPDATPPPRAGPNERAPAHEEPGPWVTRSALPLGA